MLDTQDNFKPSPSNILSLKGKTASSSSVPRQKHDIIEPEILREERMMPHDTYSKSEIDLKLDKINSDTQHGFEKMDLKFDSLEKRMDLRFENFEKRIETMLLTQENKRLEDQARNKKEFMYWFIGLLVSTILGILAIIVTILTTK